MILSGKTALVTGGGTGIGAGIANGLADAGCRVAIAGRREEKLREVAEGYNNPEAPPLLFHTVDVADRDSVQQLVDWATQELGRVDILVNSAGVNVRKRTMAELDPNDWDMVMQVNATGVYNCFRAVLPQMRERKDGLIVNISSIAGLRALLLAGVSYCASKFAATAIGTTVGQEEKDNGIRVTNIYPGEVETPILDQRPNPVSAEHRARILQPSDIAALVVTIAGLPPRAHISDLTIKPTTQQFC